MPHSIEQFEKPGLRGPARLICVTAYGGPGVYWRSKMRAKFPLVYYPIWVKLVPLLVCIGLAFFEVNRHNADVFFLV